MPAFSKITHKAVFEHAGWQPLKQCFDRANLVANPSIQES